MENKKVQYLINIINDMDLKDKLRLAICMSQSKWAGLIYNTKENYEKFDKILKEVDEEYRTTLINFSKYKLVMFAMAKIMEMTKEEQNQVALFLFNAVILEFNMKKHFRIMKALKIFYNCIINLVKRRKG